MLWGAQQTNHAPGNGGHIATNEEFVCKMRPVAKGPNMALSQRQALAGEPLI